MLKNRKIFLFLLVVLFGGFVAGTLKLFHLRLERGDVYPPSSSLRADPLGAKVFYESLGEMNSIELSRLYEPLQRVGVGTGKTLFLLGTGVWNLDSVVKQEVKEIETFVFEGGRIVISFAPVNSKNWRMRREEEAAEEKRAKEKKDETANDKKKERKEMPIEDGEDEWVSLLEKWNLKPEFVDLEIDDGVAIPVDVSRSTYFPALPQVLAWHTALCFGDVSNQWQAVYSRDTNAVVLERAFGQGSVVLCSDSYLFSNEAMRKDRHSELLAWFVGDNRSVLFDETHLGVAADPGIAALARKYRLHGLIAGLLLMAGLFVWQNSTSLVPPYEEDQFQGRNAVVTGKDASAGFVNLLRRSISPSEVLSTCVEEWKRAGLHQRQREEPSRKIESLVAEEKSKPPRERNPLQSYRTISALLTQKKNP